MSLQRFFGVHIDVSPATSWMMWVKGKALKFLGSFNLSQLAACSGGAVCITAATSPQDPSFWDPFGILFGAGNGRGRKLTCLSSWP